MSSYEIEQALGGRAGEIGAWETVEDPVLPAAGWSGHGVEGKRKLGEYALGEEEDGESFKFQHRDKRPVNDVWDEEEWDPKRALGGLRVKLKEERRFGETAWGASGSGSGSRDQHGVKEEDPEGGIKREEWTGRLELNGGGGKGKEREKDGLVYVPNGGGWVKAEPEANGSQDNSLKAKAAERGYGESAALGEEVAIQAEPLDHIDPPPPGEALPPDIKPDHQSSASPIPDTLFKKRRPAPSARKK